MRSLSPSKAVTKIRSPLTTGEEYPGGNGGLPDDVAGRAQLRGQAAGFLDPGTVRTAEAGPVAGPRAREQQDERQQKHAAA